MPFAEYIELLQDILSRIKTTQAVAISEAGHLIARAIGSGGIVHLFGTGHSHLIAEEAFYRAGGLVAVNPILDGRLSFLAGALDSTHAEREEGYARQLLSRERIRTEDAAIVISNSGRNCAPVEMAIEMIAHGVPVVAITNVQQSANVVSRHVSGKRLFEIATVVVDTGVAEGDAILRVPGLPRAMGPSSTIAGAAIVNSIMIEAAAELVQKGKPVSVFPSGNVEATSEKDLADLMAPYQDRIRYFDGQ